MLDAPLPRGVYRLHYRDEAGQPLAVAISSQGQRVHEVAIPSDDQEDDVAAMLTGILDLCDPPTFHTEGQVPDDLQKRRVQKLLEELTKRIEAEDWREAYAVATDLPAELAALIPRASDDSLPF